MLSGPRGAIKFDKLCIELQVTRSFPGGESFYRRTCGSNASCNVLSGYSRGKGRLLPTLNASFEICFSLLFISDILDKWFEIKVGISSSFEKMNNNADNAQQNIDIGVLRLLLTTLLAIHL